MLLNKQNMFYGICKFILSSLFSNQTTELFEKTLTKCFAGHLTNKTFRYCSAVTFLKTNFKRRFQFSMAKNRSPVVYNQSTWMDSLLIAEDRERSDLPHLPRPNRWPSRSWGPWPLAAKRPPTRPSSPHPENWGKPILQVNNHHHSSSLAVQRGGTRRTWRSHMSPWLGQELLFVASSVPLNEKGEAKVLFPATNMIKGPCLPSSLKGFQRLQKYKFILVQPISHGLWKKTTPLSTILHFLVTESPVLVVTGPCGEPAAGWHGDKAPQGDQEVGASARPEC